MSMSERVEKRIESGEYDEVLGELYGAANRSAARNRCKEVAGGFKESFGDDAEVLFSAPGRTEIGGNHTDHQHGRVLAAAVNLDILAAVRENKSGKIRIKSKGYPLEEIDLSDLTAKPEETGVSISIIRGVAARFAELGCELGGVGFDAYTVSTVPGGSGLSSSAAFEVLVGTIINHLFCDNTMTAVGVAQIGQYAENVFFGKPCGLMDQTACSVGSVVAIDFDDPQNPIVEQIPLDLAANGHALCILDSGADHADLTDEYAAIPAEMSRVAEFFGKKFLREVPKEQVMDNISALRKATGDRAVLRALHFYGDNTRAKMQAEAIKQGEFERFLALVRESGQSSALLLQNITPTGVVEHQEIMLTIALCKEILGDRGAVRVHGGGFAGTVQAFVPLDMLEEFKQRTEQVLGEGRCHVLSVRSVGGIRL